MVWSVVLKRMALFVLWDLCRAADGVRVLGSERLCIEGRFDPTPLCFGAQAVARLPRLEDPRLGIIHPSVQYIFFVDVEFNVSLYLSCILESSHAKLLYS